VADNRPNEPKPIKVPSEETLVRLVDLQAQELAQRAKEFELRHQELKHNSTYAEKMLDAQVQDRKDERNHAYKQTRIRYFSSGVLTFAIMGFAAFALYLNKDVIVMEALKIVGSGAAGAIGGYYYGRSRKDPPGDSPGQDPPTNPD
jgi:hypothetical protein